MGRSQNIAWTSGQKVRKPRENIKISSIFCFRVGTKFGKSSIEPLGLQAASVWQLESRSPFAGIFAKSSMQRKNPRPDEGENAPADFSWCEQWLREASSTANQLTLFPRLQTLDHEQRGDGPKQQPDANGLDAGAISRRTDRHQAYGILSGSYRGVAGTFPSGALRKNPSSGNARYYLRYGHNLLHHCTRN